MKKHKKSMNECTRMIALLMIICCLLISFISCNDAKPTYANPFNRVDGLVEGEINVLFQEPISEKFLNDFLTTFSNYNLSVLSYKLNGGFIFSFNYNLIEAYRLLTEIKQYPMVIYAVLSPGWIQGELILGLDVSINEDELQNFVLSFSKWELKLISHAISINYVKLSFNPELIDEFDFRKMIANHSIVKWVDFNGPNRQWESGKLLVELSDNDATSFIDKYSTYDLRLCAFYELSKLLVVEFNTDKIDEFEMYEIINNDTMVQYLSFNYFEEVTRGEKNE
ncbi:MAG: hypothetical protein FWG98_14020 [Candidatus Cloacimonetes bacterium]|nr:hypothetical protein [Candidatus Cloacimonadota bacterium]